MNILISGTNHHHAATTKKAGNIGEQRTVLPIITVFLQYTAIYCGSLEGFCDIRTTNLKHLTVLVVLRQLILRRSCWALFSKRVSDSKVNYGHQITNNNSQTQQHQCLHCCKDSKHCLNNKEKLENEN